MSLPVVDDQTPIKHRLEELETVTIRFAGDSGDGMQVTGTQFTTTSAVIGNDISTLPDFPAEIRAPAGSLPGVSGYQLNFSSRDIRTPGDEPNVLVAMNPAALKTNLRGPRGWRHSCRQHRCICRRQSQESRLRSQSARRRLAFRLSPLQGSDHYAHAEGARVGQDSAQAAGAMQELLRARVDVLALRPAARNDLSLDQTRSLPRRLILPTPTRWRSRLATTTPTRRRYSRRTTASARRRSNRASIETLRAMKRLRSDL